MNSAAHDGNTTLTALLLSDWFSFIVVQYAWHPYE